MSTGFISLGVNGRVINLVHVVSTTGLSTIMDEEAALYHNHPPIGTPKLGLTFIGTATPGIGYETVSETLYGDEAIQVHNFLNTLAYDLRPRPPLPTDFFDEGKFQEWVIELINNASLHTNQDPMHTYAKFERLLAGFMIQQLNTFRMTQANGEFASSDPNGDDYLAWENANLELEEDET
jgi:hypothetical protein